MIIGKHRKLIQFIYVTPLCFCHQRLFIDYHRMLVNRQRLNKNCASFSSNLIDINLQWIHEGKLVNLKNNCKKMVWSGRAVFMLAVKLHLGFLMKLLQCLMIIMKSDGYSFYMAVTIQICNVLWNYWCRFIVIQRLTSSSLADVYKDNTKYCIKLIISS